MSFAPLGQRDIGLMEREDIYERPQDDTFGALRRAQQSYLNVLEQRWKRRLYGRLNVPVGVRQPTISSIPVSQPSLPSVVQQTTSPQAREISRQIVRPQASPNETQLPITRDGAQNMDLGSILGGIRDVAETYYDVKYMDPRRRVPREIMDERGFRSGADLNRTLVDYEVGPYRGSRIRGFTPGQIVGGVVGGALGDLAEQGLNLLSGREDFGGPMDNCAKPSDYVGQWDEASATYVLKKKRKRRRKQLITQSDIKGLAALKGVVGTGKIMETWIATHC